MGWYYRSPTAFPAIQHLWIKTAIDNPNEKIVCDSSIRRANLDAIAEQIRWLKWCVKREPTAVPLMTRALAANDIRTSIEQDEVGYILYLTARPTKLSEFIRLNPTLANELLPQCQ